MIFPFSGPPPPPKPVPEDHGIPCGAVDAVSGAICSVTLVKHDVHQDVSPDITFTWIDREVVLVTP